MPRRLALGLILVACLTSWPALAGETSPAYYSPNEKLMDYFQSEYGRGNFVREIAVKPYELTIGKDIAAARIKLDGVVNDFIAAYGSPVQAFYAKDVNGAKYPCLVYLVSHNGRYYRFEASFYHATATHMRLICRDFSRVLDEAAHSGLAKDRAKF